MKPKRISRTHDPRWTPQQIEEASRIRPADVARALELIRSASPELAAMVKAKSPTIAHKKKGKSS